MSNTNTTFVIRRFSHDNESTYLLLKFKHHDKAKEQGFHTCSECKGKGQSRYVHEFGNLKVLNIFDATCKCCGGTRKQFTANPDDKWDEPLFHWTKRIDVATKFTEESEFYEWFSKIQSSTNFATDYNYQPYYLDK